MDNTYIPFNEKAEQALLGAIMLDEHVLGMLQAAGLVSKMFYLPFHRLVFNSILKLQKSGSGVDLAMVSDLMVRETIQFTHDDTRLEHCIDICVGSAMALSYLASMIEVYKLRKLQTTLKEATKRLEGEGASDPDDLLAHIRQELSEISINKVEQRSKIEVVEDIIAEARNSSKSGSAGVSSKWLQLQRKLAGYRYGKSTIIAARPKCGKTTLMCEECNHSADYLEIPTGIISIEMTRDEILRKIAAGRAEVDTLEIDNGDISVEDFERFAAELRKIAELPLEIVDDPMNIEKLMATMRVMASEGIKRIGIDYLQLIQPSGSTKKGNRQQEVSYWSNCITNLTKELGVSTLLLSQLNRTSARDNDKPDMSQLRDSGSIEQDAAAILLISELQGKNVSFKREKIVIVDVAANRFGPTGEVELIFKPYHQKFVASLEES